MIVISYDDIVQDILPMGYNQDIIDTINWADELLRDEPEPWNIRSQFER